MTLDEVVAIYFLLSGIGMVLFRDELFGPGAESTEKK